VASERPPIAPIKTRYHLPFLSGVELDGLRAASLQMLAEVGVKVGSEKSLTILKEAGAEVDEATTIVKLPTELVLKAMSTVPRYFWLGARDAAFDIELGPGVSYFTTDGCGAEAVDPETGERRPSRKEDMARIARIADALPSISFMYPTVAATDFGETARLHELDAVWNNLGKHMMGMINGGKEAAYAVEMARVVAGGAEQLRRRPVLSNLICTVAPLCLDREAMDAALVFAEAGVPVAIMAMPTLGTTAPATRAGALAMADAEVVAATVVLQLAYPGAPCIHSILPGWADPRSGNYIGYPVDMRTWYAPVEIGHHWGMPTLGGAYGTASPTPGTWQAAAEVGLDPLLVGLAGAELVTSMGLNDTYTVMYPEGIFLDAELYERARYALMDLDVSEETLAVDIVRAVGPGGHFLGQAHTRKHLRHATPFAITQSLDAEGHYRDPVKVARERFDEVYRNYWPEPLEADKQAALTEILARADAELR